MIALAQSVAAAATPLVTLARLAGVARAAADPSLWYVTRAAGISAYVLLAGTVALGLIRTIQRTAKSRHASALALVDEAHQFAALLAVAFVVVHLVALVFDPVLPFTLSNLLLPFDEPYRATATALGVLGLYALGVVALSSWVRRALPYRFWRWLHGVSFVTFALVTLHGILAGTDSGQPWMALVYWVAVILVGLLSLVRLARLSRGAAASTALSR
jgi:predicted ferric reductase